jgi:hypothetical protein
MQGKGLRSGIRAPWGQGWTRLPFLYRGEKYCHDGGRPSSTLAAGPSDGGHDQHRGPNAGR